MKTQQGPGGTWNIQALACGGSGEFSAYVMLLCVHVNTYILNTTILNTTVNVKLHLVNRWGTVQCSVRTGPCVVWCWLAGGVLVILFWSQTS